MTPYDVKIAPLALRHIEALTGKQKRWIIKFIEALAYNPRPPSARKITGVTGLYSDVVNALRLVYKIEEQEIVILLIK